MSVTVLGLVPLLLGLFWAANPIRTQKGSFA
jgi:hypothetical protein